MKEQLSFNFLETLPSNALIYVNDKPRAKLFSSLGFQTLTDASEALGINLNNFSRYRLGRRGMPASFFKRLLDISKIPLENFQNKIRISIGNTGHPIRLGPLISADAEWVYIAELIRGDGHISDNLWYIVFVDRYDKPNKIVNHVKMFFTKKGVPSESFYIRRHGDALFLTIRSNIFAFILKNLFQVPTGRKGDMKLPSFYWTSKIFAAAAIRAAFDAEGTVSLGKPSPRRISITSISRSWLSDIRALLRLLNIDSEVHQEDRPGTTPIYRLRIYGQINLRRFLKTVKPVHPRKLIKLKKLLSTYRQNRVPEGTAKTKILAMLRDSGPMKREQIAHSLHFKKNLLSWHLSSLQKKNLVRITERVYTNKGSYFKYGITELGLAEFSSNEDRPFRE